MTKKLKLKTPEWILQGYDSEEEFNMQKSKSSTSPKQSDDSSPKAKGIENKKTGKTFKIRKCPECGSDDVKVVITGEEGRGNNWECKSCGWKGADIRKEEVSEEEFMKYLDEKEVEVA